MIRILFYLVVILHFVFLIFNAISLIILPFKTPFYIWLPLMTWLVALVTNPIKCMITSLENKLRKKLGMPEIKGFVYHYILRRS
jgi:hypothetical protein